MKKENRDQDLGSTEKAFASLTNQQQEPEPTHPRKWFAPMPSLAHYWRLQKLYFVAGLAGLPFAAIGAVLIVRYGYHDALMTATVVVGVIAGQIAWRWADRRMPRVEK